MMPMKQTERDETLLALYQAVVGIPDNPSENGVLGEVREVKSLLNDLNGRVRTNTVWRKAHTWAIGLVGSALVALLTKLQGLW